MWGVVSTPGVGGAAAAVLGGLPGDWLTDLLTG